MVKAREIPGADSPGREGEGGRGEGGCGEDAGGVQAVLGWDIVGNQRSSQTIRS
jgi:hypothetical protein